MEQRKWMLAIAAAVVVLIVVIIVAYHTCRLGRYSKKGCRAEKFNTMCGGTMPDPAALAELEALRSMGFRQGVDPDVPGPGTSCPGRASAAAIAEAQALQQAYGLAPGSPYYEPGWTSPPAPHPAPHILPYVPAPHILPYVPPAPDSGGHTIYVPGRGPIYIPTHSKSNFAAGEAGYAGCGEPVSPQALGEAGMLAALQAGPGGYDVGDVDDFAVRKLSRDKAAFSSTRARSENLRSNPAQTSARRARFSSMREGFGGPAEGGGFGWSPADGGPAEARAQGAASATCVSNCVEGCVGTNCSDLCQGRCSGSA